MLSFGLTEAFVQNIMNSWVWKA